MGRVIPKLTIAEFTLDRDIDDETLTIASDTATTTYKPVKYGSETITSGITTYVRDTNYTINYTTGVVTEITGMDDDDYNIDYLLDPYVLDISSITDGMLNISRVEYPLNQNPQSYPTVNWYDDFLYFTGEDILVTGKHVKIIYYKNYLVPTEDEAGDYPLHLDTAVITGAIGNALLNKANTYAQSGITALDSIDAVITSLNSLSITLPSTPSFTADMTLPAVDDLPTAPTFTADLTLPDTTPTAPTWGDDASLPTPFPTAPSFPDTPTLPSAPSLTYTDLETALDAIATQIDKADTFLTSGTSLINKVNAGRDVGDNYAKFAGMEIEAASTYAGEAAQRMRQLETELNEYKEEIEEYATAVNKFNADINLYAQENADIANQNAVYLSAVGKYSSDIGKYSEEIHSYAAEVERYRGGVERLNVDVGLYAQELNAFIAKMNRYGQAADRFNADITLYDRESFAILNEFSMKKTKYVEQITALSNTSKEYFAATESNRKEGTAKLGEFYAMIGARIEMGASSTSPARV